MIKRAENQLKCAGCNFAILKGWWKETIGKDNYHEVCIPKATEEAPIVLPVTKKMKVDYVFKAEDQELVVVRIVRGKKGKEAHCRPIAIIEDFGPAAVECEVA